MWKELVGWRWRVHQSCTSPKNVKVQVGGRIIQRLWLWPNPVTTDVPLLQEAALSDVGVMIKHTATTWVPPTPHQSFPIPEAKRLQIYRSILMQLFPEPMMITMMLTTKHLKLKTLLLTQRCWGWPQTAHYSSQAIFFPGVVFVLFDDLKHGHLTRLNQGQVLWLSRSSSSTYQHMCSTEWRFGAWLVLQRAPVLLRWVGFVLRLHFCAQAGSRIEAWLWQGDTNAQKHSPRVHLDTVMY